MSTLIQLNLFGGWEVKANLTSDMPTLSPIEVLTDRLCSAHHIQFVNISNSPFHLIRLMGRVSWPSPLQRWRGAPHPGLAQEKPALSLDVKGPPIAHLGATTVLRLSSWTVQAEGLEGRGSASREARRLLDNNANRACGRTPPHPSPPSLPHLPWLETGNALTSSSSKSTELGKQNLWSLFDFVLCSWKTFPKVVNTFSVLSF